MTRKGKYEINLIVGHCNSFIHNNSCIFQLTIPQVSHVLAGLGAIESVDYNYCLIRGIVASAEEGLRAVNIDDHASFVFPVVVVGCREETKRQEAIREMITRWIYIYLTLL